MSTVTPQLETRSLQDYARLLHRQRSLIAVTVVVCCLIVLPLGLLTPPRYRAHCRLQFARESVPTSPAALDALFTPIPADTGSQAEMLQNPVLLADIARTLHLSLATLRLQVKPVVGTELLEMSCEASRSEDAMQFLRRWPLDCNDMLRAERAEQATRAIGLLRQRLRDAKLELARANQLLFATHAENATQKKEGVEEGISENVASRAVEEAVETQQQERMATASLRRQQAHLLSVEQALRRQPASRLVHQWQLNPHRATVQEEIAKLQTEQARLNVLLTPENTELKQLQAQIAHLQAEEREIPATLDNAFLTADPLRERLQSELMDAHARLMEAEADVRSAQQASRAADAHMSQARSEAGQRTAAQQERECWQPIVNTLTADLNALALRTEAFSAPLRTVVPAGEVEKISPNPLINLLYAALLGLALGLSLAFLREPLSRGTLSEPLRDVPPVRQEETEGFESATRGGVAREAGAQAVVLGREPHFITLEPAEAESSREATEGNRGEVWRVSSDA